MSAQVYHIPALLQECIDGLSIKPSGTYVDVTFGGGGHSRAILEKLGADGHLYSFDQDQDAEVNILHDSRFTFVHSNFRFLKNFMRYYGVSQIDGLIADLGVSFHHFDEADRGFSFRYEGALDMRMNQKAEHSAAWIIANYSEEQIADMLYLYGELKSSRRLASAIVKARANRSIDTTSQLLEVIKPLINVKQEKKELAQVFQALRIEVNNEISTLKSMLQQTIDVLRPGGRITILTYHSLEDRLVKNFLKTGNIEGKMDKDFFGRVNTPFRLINNKVIAPSEEEVAMNPRARSAKLRIAERIESTKNEDK